MDYFRTLLCLFLSVCLCACSHSSRRQDALRKVASHQVDPSDSFLDGNQLYVQYDYQGESFFFTADLSNVVFIIVIYGSSSFLFIPVEEDVGNAS